MTRGKIIIKGDKRKGNQRRQMERRQGKTEGKAEREDGRKGKQRRQKERRKTEGKTCSKGRHKERTGNKRRKKE